jgi:Transcriptional regulator PadR-like family
MHGYEIIHELEARTDGLWRPSPGSIYPTLQLLEDEERVTGEESEGKHEQASDMYASDARRKAARAGFGSPEPSRRRDSNPRPPLYESAQRGETEGSEGSSEGINALQIRLF